MALSWKTRRRLSLLILVIGLPLYIMLAVSLVSVLGRPGPLVELMVYIGLGLVWILPFRAVFRGIAQPEPDPAGRLGSAGAPGAGPARKPPPNA